eukprot:jgi/Chrzof1/10509/Cz05g01130.t1
MHWQGGHCLGQTKPSPMCGVSRRLLLSVCRSTTPVKTVRGKKTVRESIDTKRTVSNTRTARGVKQQTDSRRQLPPQQQQQQKHGSRFYLFFTGFPFPIGPFWERKTCRYEVVRNTVWTFEQTQSIDVFSVFTPVRMTVIKLKSGGLWVHAPVAPTEECIRLIKELDAPVEYIVLPTYAYEHKVFVGPFSRKFPKAKVYVTPYQWSYPLNLPPQFFGIFPAGTLQNEDPDTPWADEIEQKLFLSPSLGIGDYVRFTEVAFFHKASSTLMVTDAVVYIDDKPPDVIPKQALMAVAKDGFLSRFVAGGRSRQEVAAVARDGPVEDNEENRRLSWQRMSLLVLYFGPSDLLTPQESFDAISKRVLVGPVVRTLVYNKIPNTVCDWVDSICADWKFNRIIPAHFCAPVKAGPSEFREAFRFAYEAAERPFPSTSGNGPLGGLLGGLFGGGTGRGNGRGDPKDPELPEADLKTLNVLDNFLLRIGAVYSDAESRT